jgi:nucleoside-diphosphate-sugar epimerase
VNQALAASGARIVIHQLTDLPRKLDPAQLADVLARNARIRETGTRYLVAAAVACGAVRLVAQSIAFAYAPGVEPFVEEAPLDIAADGPRGVSSRGVASLESQVLGAPMVALVLRYGRLYGPGTGVDTPPRGLAVHVDAAADAARRAVTLGSRGLYNVAEAGGSVVIDRARHELGWDPDFRIDS